MILANDIRKTYGEGNSETYAFTAPGVDQQARAELHRHTFGIYIAFMIASVVIGVVGLAARSTGHPDGSHVRSEFGAPYRSLSLSPGMVVRTVD